MGTMQWTQLGHGLLGLEMSFKDKLLSALTCYTEENHRLLQTVDLE